MHTYIHTYIYTDTHICFDKLKTFWWTWVKVWASICKTEGGQDAAKLRPKQIIETLNPLVCPHFNWSACKDIWRNPWVFGRVLTCLLACVLRRVPVRVCLDLSASYVDAYLRDICMYAHAHNLDRWMHTHGHPHITFNTHPCTKAYTPWTMPVSLHPESSFWLKYNVLKWTLLSYAAPLRASAAAFRSHGDRACLFVCPAACPFVCPCRAFSLTSYRVCAVCAGVHPSRMNCWCACVYICVHVRLGVWVVSILERVDDYVCPFEGL